MDTEDLIDGCSNNPTFTLAIELLDMYGINEEIVKPHQTYTNDHALCSISSNSYKWKLYDHYNQKRMLNSNTFNINGVVYMFQFYKYRYTSWNPGNAMLLLNVLKIPDRVESICIIYCMSLKETNSKYWWFGIVNKKNKLHLKQVWPEDDRSVRWPEIKDLNTLTFGVYTEIVNAYDKDGNCIVYNEQKQVISFPDPKCYQWKISPKQDLTQYLILNGFFFILIFW